MSYSNVEDISKNELIALLEKYSEKFEAFRIHFVNRPTYYDPVIADWMIEFKKILEAEG